MLQQEVFASHSGWRTCLFGGDTRMHCKDMCELAQSLLLMVSASKANGWFSTVVLLKTWGILEMKSIVSILNQKIRDLTPFSGLFGRRHTHVAYIHTVYSLSWPIKIKFVSKEKVGMCWLVYFRLHVMKIHYHICWVTLAWISASPCLS